MTRKSGAVRLACCLAALMAVVPAGPLAAQDDAARTAQDAGGEGEEEALLPAGMTPDQLIQFFTNFSESEEMEAAVAPEIEAMMARGEPVAGWQEQGIDILSELAARKGGAQANLLHDLDDEVLSVTDLSGSLRPDLEGFESYALRPEPVGLVAERSLSSFLPGIWIEAASQRSVKGNALCYGGYFGITLHTRRPYSEWSEDELLFTATLFALFDRMSAREFCLVYDRDGRGRYTARAFTPDGAPLPALNAEMTAMVVMPRAKLDEFLGRTPVMVEAQADPEAVAPATGE